MERLFDLPPELTDRIFDEIAFSRSFKRVMRLRLVSQTFKKFIEDAIIRQRLLEGESAIPRPIFTSSRAEAARVFILEYLARRTWLEQNPASLLGRIRHATVTISHHLGETSEDAIFARMRTLCRLALGHTLWMGHHQVLLGYDVAKKKTLRPATTITPQAQAIDVCVAAVYLGLRPYVEKLIAKGYQFCTAGGIVDMQSGVFGHAFKAAAAQGDVSMMRLLMSSNPHVQPPETPPSWMRREILKAASLSGHKEAFDFALNLGPLELAAGEKAKGDSRRFPDWIALQEAIAATPQPSNYIRAAAMFGPDSKVFKPRMKGDVRTRLARKAQAGHLEMVRYFLDKEHLQQSSDTPLPLYEAALGGNAEVVKLLLAHGADPNYDGTRSPLMAAARLGNMPVVKVLLDAGANVNEGLPPPFVMAVYREDMEMFRLLRHQRGARLDTPETGGWAMAIARLYKLESVVDALLQEGVERDATLHRCAGLDERRQTEYLLPLTLFGSS